MELLQILANITLGLGTLSLALITLIQKNRYRKQDEVEREMKEIKENYIDRFDKVDKSIAKIDKNVVDLNGFIQNELKEIRVQVASSVADRAALRTDLKGVKESFLSHQHILEDLQKTIYAKG